MNINGNCKKILVTGLSGQDGSYMAEYCLSLGHQVYGMVRRTSSPNDKNFKHLLKNENLQIVYGDLTDFVSISTLIQKIKPDYFINLAAQSFVFESWNTPYATFQVDAIGVLNCLEAIRLYLPTCRFYQAGSSEMWGDVIEPIQNEQTPFRPRSPYGASKVAAHFVTKVYRESYNLYAISGILLNHESERRGEVFLTRKITKGLANIVWAINNNQPFESLKLGNIYTKRDWSHAEDFIKGIWKMLNQEKFDKNFKEKIENLGLERSPIHLAKYLSKNITEYVLSSNETHLVKEFADIALKFAGIKGYWKGKDLNEKFFTTLQNKDVPIIEIDSKLFRPAEVNLLHGDSSLARKRLEWKTEVSFENLIKRMTENDIKEVKNEKSQ